METELIPVDPEQEGVDAPPGLAIAKHDASAQLPPDAVGVMALARISEADFDARIAALRVGMARLRKVQTALLRYGTDYGKIKGIERPCLFKSGAEKLSLAFGLVPTFDVHVEHGDGVRTPPVTVLTTCSIHVGTEDGPVVAQGIGSANSWERKHRWRRAERACPSCGKATIRKSKNDGEGWYCWAKLGGCGVQFVAGDQAIEGQELGDVENPDPYDLHNTLVKMSGKRSLVDGTMRATGTSALWTQDVEEHGELEPEALPGEDASKDDRIAAARKAQDGAKGKAKAATAPAVSEKDQPFVTATLAEFAKFTLVDEYTIWAENVQWPDGIADAAKNAIRRAWKTGAETIASKGAA